MVTLQGRCSTSAVKSAANSCYVGKFCETLDEIKNNRVLFVRVVSFLKCVDSATYLKSYLNDCGQKNEPNNLEG